MANKKYPVTSVKIILKYKNQILILKHPGGTFDFPGGTVEMKETLIDALKRELIEELHYRLENEPKLFDVWSYISKSGEKHIIIIYYALTIRKKPALNSPENLEILWLTKREMKRFNIIKDKKFLNRLFRQ